MKIFTQGNKKLSSNVWIFSIPATPEICGRSCKGCYAKKQLFPSVKKHRWSNFELSKQDNFVETIEGTLKTAKKPPKFVRIHAAGEFYSREYFRKWCEIARRCPHIIFYTYTKKLDLPFEEAPKNLVIHKSIINGHINFADKGTVERLQKKFGGFVCPLSHDRTQQCGDSCTWCMQKSNEGTPIWFVKH